MAPYVFDVNVSSEDPIHCEREQTMNIDGHTSVETTKVDDKNTRVTITKGGGTDGLFTMVPFWIGPSGEDAKVKFDVYCQMGASGGSHPIVLLGDCTTMGWNEFNDNTDRARQYWLDDMRSRSFRDSVPIGDTIEQNGLKVSAGSARITRLLSVTQVPR